MPTHYWMIKWNKDGDLHQDRKRIWLDFLELPPLAGTFCGYEFDHPSQRVASLYDLMGEGDVVFCYQVDKRAVVGLAIVCGKAAMGDEKRVDLTPAYVLRKPARVHSLKLRNRTLASAECLKHGPQQTLYLVLPNEAVELFTLSEQGLRTRMASLLEEFWSARKTKLSRDADAGNVQTTGKNLGTGGHS